MEFSCGFSFVWALFCRLTSRLAVALFYDQLSITRDVMSVGWG